MDVREAISTRRSIRSYSNIPVEEEKLLQVLEAGRLAPSARNRQEWRFILVRKPEILGKLAEASENQPSMLCAPAVIAAVSTRRYEMKCGQPADCVDLSIAMSYMMLQANELGLGTCWLGRFSAEKAAEALGIPGDCSVVSISPIGYPAETPETRPRKPFTEVVSFDKF